MSETDIQLYLVKKGFIRAADLEEKQKKPDPPCKAAIKSTIIPASKPNDLSIESEGMPADFIQKVKMIRYAQAQGVEIRLNELCTWEKQHQQDSEQQLAQQAATSQISDLLTIIKPKNSLPKSNISVSTTTSTPSNSTTTSAPNNS
jgi:hypothetical protein